MTNSETTAGWQGDGPSAGGGPARDLTGQLVGGDFLVDRPLGRGGMGEVYLARQRSLNRPVALKVLKPELASNPTYLSRFEVEATAVARLNHPNIVQVFTLGHHGDLRFIAMEFVQGTNLREYLTKKGTVELPLALSFMRQTCQAIAAAGDLGLIHRDVKPENLLLTRKGQVKVADFGLCREQGADALQLTQEGVTLGTPMYMSPEQVRGHALDHRSDLYSMGVTFYHMLAGSPPFRAESAVAMALKHLQDTPIDLAVHRPDLPPELVALVMKLMAKKREDRYQSAREVDRELARLKGIVSATRAVAAAPSPSGEIPAQDTPPPAGPRPGRGRPIARRAWSALSDPSVGGGTLALLGVLGLVAGAALGWSDRPRDPTAAGPPPGPAASWMAPTWEDIPRQPSPRAQLRYAQLVARPQDRPAALLAVPGHFPGDPGWALTSYTHLARLLFGRLDRDGLVALAESLEAAPGTGAEPDAPLPRLAEICRAAAAALDDRPADVVRQLTALAPAPSHLEPGSAELALEVVEWARGAPGAEAQAPQWDDLRDDLFEALRLMTLDPADRFEPGRRRPPGRPSP
ncbi:serine/threonine-protein kinase [Tautonia plasticadhaerens]|uniref:non-specific serine/threonine protein kinase n=1 Tax=Tautonia plasticadhaerens TaxID=2527974 RepID=A0A518H3K5_9BACT|nr:serine/threonine-protein kinase [Tautonia plasticadhaerens]QDV35419.1 Serine/threonine-protein kinase PknB [Tautonia plasticadhaerens]